MRKPVRILVIALAAVAAGLAVLLMAISIFGGSLVKKAVQLAGTSALRLPVALSGADLSVLSGTVALRGLDIDNPPGYQREKLLTLDHARIAVHTSSLLSDTVRIRQITLDGIDLVLEQKGLGSNLQDVINNLPRSTQEEGKEPTGKRLQIDVLEIRNVTVKALLSVSGKAAIPLRLSTIRLTDLGKKDSLDATALTGKIILAIARGIVEQGNGLLPRDVVTGVGSALNKTLEVGKGVIKGAAEVGKGIKGLFTPRK